MPPDAACLPQILLIEDDAAWGRLFTTGLDLHGSVEWAKTFDEAKQLLEDRPFELVVSDLRLPGGDIRPLLMSLPRRGGRPSLLLVSGNADLASIAIECGADASLPKPLRLKILRETVLRLLQQPPPATAVRTAHSLVFFDTDEIRVEAAAHFCAEGLRQGERAIVVVEDRLRISLADRVRQLAGAAPPPLFLAAESLGEQVLRNGMPSRRLLGGLAHSILAPLGTELPIRFYGEGVELLASRGLHRAAVQLERLWNELLPVTKIRMLCGFSTQSWQHQTCGCMSDLKAEHDPAA